MHRVGHRTVYRQLTGKPVAVNLARGLQRQGHDN
jgi:hypothetical protein